MKDTDKRFYWLKLNKDFFKQHEITVIEGMHNGKDYILFYLKLLCESLSHDGSLRFSDEIPYDEEMLANLTHTNIDIVRVAVQLFTKLNLMEIYDDGTMFMKRVKELTGSESQWAPKKRNYRDKQRQLETLESGQLEDSARTLSDKSIRDKSIKKEEFVSKDTHSWKESTQKNEGKPVYDALSSHDTALEWQRRFNEISGIVKCRKLTVQKEMLVSALVSHFSEEEIDKAFDNLARSSYLHGQNDRGWTATFDWFINMNNFAKVFDGNYNDHEGTKKKVATDVNGQYANFKETIITDF